MRDPAIQEIGTLVVKRNGYELDVRDFAPLLTPTVAVLERIARDGGPVISPDTIVAKMLGVPVMTIDGTYGLGIRLGIESSAIPEHADALQRVRIAELQNLFARFFNGPQEQREALVARPETSAAANLMVALMRAALGLILGKHTVLQCPDYDIHATWLRDTKLSQ